MQAGIQIRKRKALGRQLGERNVLLGFEGWGPPLTSHLRVAWSTQCRRQEQWKNGDNNAVCIQQHGEDKVTGVMVGAEHFFFLSSACLIFVPSSKGNAPQMTADRQHGPLRELPDQSIVNDPMKICYWQQVPASDPLGFWKQNLQWVVLRENSAL